MSSGPDQLLFSDADTNDYDVANLPEPEEDLDFAVERWQRAQDKTYKRQGIHPTDICFGEPEPGSAFDLDTELPEKYMHRVREVGCTGELITILLRKESPSSPRPQSSQRAKFGVRPGSVVEWGCNGQPQVLRGSRTHSSWYQDGTFDSVDPLTYGLE